MYLFMKKLTKTEEETDSQEEIFKLTLLQTMSSTITDLCRKNKNDIVYECQERKLIKTI